RRQLYRASEILCRSPSQLRSQRHEIHWSPRTRRREAKKKLTERLRALTRDPDSIARVVSDPFAETPLPIHRSCHFSFMLRRSSGLVCAQGTCLEHWKSHL